jgi:histo-blood group ABO system transferase
MLKSAATYFMADGAVDRVLLRFDGRHGWPDATIYRYAVILEQAARMADASHVFLIDADMRFVAPVGQEILAPLVATTHPGYVGLRGTYEQRPESTAFVGDGEGTTYICGAFVGGERDPFLALAEAVQANVAGDAARGITALWHDESHLNRYLIDHPPNLVLSPSYCYPEHDRYYVRNIWSQPYERRILALVKPRRLRWWRRFH